MFVKHAFLDTIKFKKPDMHLYSVLVAITSLVD